MSELNPTASMPNEELIERLKKLNNWLIERGALRLSVPVQSTDDDMLIAEAARRLAALPRIYDVAKGERPEDLSTVIAIGPGDVLSSESTYLADTDTIDSGYYDDCKGHRERVAGFQFMVDVDDLAAWIKGVKG